MSVESGLAAQVRNIEKTYGKPIAAWLALVKASKLQKHTEVVAMLKREHGLAHGAAHRIGLLARAETATAAGSSGESSGQPGAGTPAGSRATGGKPAPSDQDPAGALYAGKKEALRPIHDALMKAIGAFAKDLEVAPKAGYVSLRSRKQFAMIKPAAKHVEVGLILRDVAPTARLEASGTFNALFTHRVRVATVADVDKALVAWLRKAYDAAS